MKTLIHFCKKDLAFAKPWLIGAWVALALVAVLPAVEDADLAEPLLLLGRIAPLLLVFAATLKIMRGDPLTGSTGFIATRPLPRPFLLATKLASIAIFVLIPAVLASMLEPIAMRVNPSPADYGLLAMEKSLDYGLAISIALLVGAFTRGIGAATLLTVGLGLLVVWLFASIHGRPGGFQLMAEARHLKISRWLLAQALLPLSVIGIIWFWTACRRPVRTLLVAVLALGSSVSIAILWQWNFVEILASHEVPGTDRARVEWLGEPSLSGGRRNGIEFISVVHPAEVSGIPEGWLGHPAGYRSTMRFADGTTLSSESMHSSRGGGGFTLPLPPALGITLPADHPSRLRAHESPVWFEIEASRIHEQPDRRPSITGEAIMELYQPLVLASLPPISGASAVHGRFRYSVESIQTLDGSISVKLSIRAVPLASRGDSIHRMDGVDLILMDPATGEHTIPGGSGGSSSTLGGLHVISKTLRLGDWRQGHDAPATDAFLQRARLFIIGRDYGGTVTLPFEIPAVPLENHPLDS